MKDLEKIQELDKKYLFQNYGDRLPVAFSEVRGPFLYDVDGKKYIDFLSGISVTNIGGDNKAFIENLHAQLDRILHSSNWFFNLEQIEAAKKISELSFAGKTLFVNSGTEANEAAIKLARKYGQSISPEHYNIIVFSKSFHGRTFGSMSATGNEKIRTGFGPVVPGFIYIPFNDREALENAFAQNKVCAVMTELIQGEGGINLIDKDFCLFIEETARKNRALFIVDEVQTGIGRTGTHFVHQHFGISPDIMTLAKGLGNGIPVGAVHARDDAAECLTAGSHGSTFGGNHLASVAALSVLEQISSEGFMEHIHILSETAFYFLQEMQKKQPLIREVRGLGLHIGIELSVGGMDLVKLGLEKGLVLNCTAGNVIRIMPPLTVPKEVLLEGLELFDMLLDEFAGKQM